MNPSSPGWRLDDGRPFGGTETTIQSDGLTRKLHTLDKNHSKNNNVRTLNNNVRTFPWLR